MSLRVAIVGAGRIAADAHLPAWRGCRNTSVNWIADRDRDLARRVAGAWDIPNWTDDVDSLAAENSLDAVDICTPASTHAKLAEKFVVGGKHVLVEKPPALSLADLQSLTDASASSSTTVMVAENWVYSPAFLSAQEAIAEGRIGKPLVLQAAHESPFWIDPLSHPRPDSDGLGYFFAAGSHTVHAARVLAGDIIELAAFGTYADASAFPPCDHEMVLAGRTSTNTLVSMTFAGRSRHAGPRRLWFKVTGETGLVEFDIWAGWTEVTEAGERHRIEHPEPHHGFQQEVQHFVDCIESKQRPRTAPAEYMHSLATVLAGYQSAVEHRVVSPKSILAN